MSLKIMTINIPEKFKIIIDKMVKDGIYENRSDFMRIAIENKINKLKREEDFTDEYLND